MRVHTFEPINSQRHVLQAKHFPSRVLYSEYEKCQLKFNEEVKARPGHIQCLNEKSISIKIHPIDIIG